MYCSKGFLERVLTLDGGITSCGNFYSWVTHPDTEQQQLPPWCWCLYSVPQPRAAAYSDSSIGYWVAATSHPCDGNNHCQSHRRIWYKLQDSFNFPNLCLKWGNRKQSRWIWAKAGKHERIATATILVRGSCILCPVLHTLHTLHTPTSPRLHTCSLLLTQHILSCWLYCALDYYLVGGAENIFVTTKIFCFFLFAHRNSSRRTRAPSILRLPGLNINKMPAVAALLL